MSEWKNGLPTVGDECEWCGEKGGYFVPADVVAISDDEIVLRHKDYQDYKPGQFDVFKHKYMKFRPLKSEAERKRDEFASEMYLTLNEFDGISMRQSTAQDLLKHLYDAGIRKVNPLTDEQINACSEMVNFVRGAIWARSQIMGED